MFCQHLNNPQRYKRFINKFQSYFLFPTIDLFPFTLHTSPITNRTLVSRPQSAKALTKASQSLDFAYITGHGFPPELLDDADSSISFLSQTSFHLLTTAHLFAHLRSIPLPLNPATSSPPSWQLTMMRWRNTYLPQSARTGRWRTNTIFSGTLELGKKYSYQTKGKNRRGEKQIGWGVLKTKGKKGEAKRNLIRRNDLHGSTQIDMLRRNQSEFLTAVRNPTLPTSINQS